MKDRSKHGKEQETAVLLKEVCRMILRFAEPLWCIKIARWENPNLR